ncbi:hypothetical protein [Methylobacterium platani]|uniref:Uncharacterized protein n=1 Tax=Methylobacterium platani TaxID=427683 RepID=A0A179SA62_9HYPH|nr:hypothetical protein [Methylobacterium platani]OAS24703.1 hypothetical protein A5481_13300 [Methylobacterium platani]
MRRLLGATLLALGGTGLGLGLGAGPAQAQRPKPPAAAKPLPEKLVTCGALSNLRILMAETGGDPAAIKARLADPKADQLGCTRIGRDRVEGNAERVVIGGTAYDCLKVKESSLCRWTLSGVPAEAP